MPRPWRSRWDGRVLLLLRAAHQLDPRRLFLAKAAIGREIIQRHAPRREARLELLADDGAVELLQAADDAGCTEDVLDDEAGEALVDDLRHRAAVEGDDRRSASPGFDHH